MINVFIFFLEYTFIRIILIPYGLYMLAYTSVYTFELLPLYRQLALIISFSQIILLSAFNFYWYGKIIKGVGKTLGCLKVKITHLEKLSNDSGAEDSEKYNRVK